jgi:hypothetical protein
MPGSRSTGLILAAALALVACDPAPEIPSMALEASRPPEHVCASAANTLDELRNRFGLVYSDQGDATIQQDIWLQLQERGREELVNTLALYAACSAPQAVTEQAVLIRSEIGVVLAQRIVPVWASSQLTQ